MKSLSIVACRQLMGGHEQPDYRRVSRPREPSKSRVAIARLMFFAFTVFSSLAIADDTNGIVGKWKANQVTYEGKPYDGTFEVTFTTTTMTLTPTDKDGKPRRVEPREYKLDSGSRPRKIIFPDEVDPMSGIYELKGDSLKMAIVKGKSTAGSIDFECKEGDRKVVLTLERIK